MPTFNSGLLVVIDSSVPNQDLLASGVPPTAQIACLHQGSGLGEVLQLLCRTHGPARELHLVAHGAPGVLYLGRERWTAETVRARAGDWARLGEALGPDSVIALTACYVAFGDEGRALLAAIADATGCRVTGTQGLVGGTRAESFGFVDPQTAIPFGLAARAAYAPVLLGAPDLWAIRDTGISNSDNITNSNFLEISIQSSFVVFGATLSLEFGEGNGFQFPMAVGGLFSTPVAWALNIDAVSHPDGVYKMTVKEDVVGGGTSFSHFFLTLYRTAVFSQLSLDPFSDTGASSSDPGFPR